MKEKKIKRSLIPDPIIGLLDIQVAGNKVEEVESSGYDVDTPSVKTFYDPNLNNTYNNDRYGKMKIPELKERCRDKNLPVSGTKKELIDRLHKHTEKVNTEKREEELRIHNEERVVVNKHKDTALLKIENNIKRLTRARKTHLDKLVKAQQTFDATETELNEMKAMLKSLEKVL